MSHKTTEALGKPSEFIFLLREIDLSMADLVGAMNALSMNGGNADVPPGSPGGNINERGEFIVRGGPENGPIIWNPTTAYIESWNQLPLHQVKIFLFHHIPHMIYNLYTNLKYKLYNIT